VLTQPGAFVSATSSSPALPDVCSLRAEGRSPRRFPCGCPPLGDPADGAGAGVRCSRPARGAALGPVLASAAIAGLSQGAGFGCERSLPGLQAAERAPSFAISRLAVPYPSRVRQGNAPANQRWRSGCRRTPAPAPSAGSPRAGSRTGSDVDYGLLHEENTRRGAQGEELVADYERAWLRQHGRPDLAARVQWAARGGELRYDVLFL